MQLSFFSVLAGRRGRSLFIFVVFNWLSVTLALAALAAEVSGPRSGQEGVVLEKVDQDSIGEKAGLQRGDLLLAWSRETESGRIDSPFTLNEVEIEQGQRGAVQVRGRRGVASKTWVLQPQAWGLTSRAVLRFDLQRLYAEGGDLFKLAKFVEAADRWRAATAQLVDSEPPWLATWLFLQIAKSEGKAGRWPECDSAYDDALRHAVHAGQTVPIQVFEAWAESFRERNDLVRAERYYSQALEESRKQGSENLFEARCLHYIADVAAARGDSPKAEDYSLQAVLIRDKLAPESRQMAAALNNLGNFVALRGDLAKAEEYHRRALAIQEKLGPGSRRIAVTLNFLAAVTSGRGDLDEAEKYCLKALEIQQKLEPASGGVAWSLANLSVIALERRDLGRAEEYARKALDIGQKQAGGNSDVSPTLRLLGEVLLRRGDLEEAEKNFRQALVMNKKFGREGIDIARNHTNLGEIAQRRGDLVAAQQYYSQAASTFEKLAPESILYAESLHTLGSLLRRQGQLDAADPVLNRALEVLETQTTRLGGNEELRSSFRARFAGYYRDYVDLLLTRQLPERAFHVVERSRARSLLAMLAERDFLFGTDLPREIQEARRRNAGQYDQVQAQMAQLSLTKDAAQVRSLQGRLRDLAVERENLAERIRRGSPRFAALQYPQPLDVSATRHALDPGTVLLSYSVGRDETVLFVVQPPGPGPPVLVSHIPVGDTALREQVKEFRQLAQQRSMTNVAALQGRAQKLYDLLLKPAEPQLAGSQRILILPDGPLHTLPFAALRRESQYLIEWKPLHVALSATVYAELKKTRHLFEPGALQLAAFGAPHYPKKDSQAVTRGDPELRSTLLERGFEFSPLPYSREEVHSITALFPGRSQEFLDSEATEERVKSISKQVRYVHFATHGILDERLPLNSALVLTIPDAVEGRDNGLLQAWEIFDQVRMDANLVVLSGCRTGLGEELSGEGLVGLTRAFQYAGAHSVLASLWSVDDRRTAQLMKCFYQHLESGASKDQALRAAQLEFLRTHAASPFYWAGFSLIGDWL
ncbi:MAG: CHAT domain-containing protein [Bryobacteraceae bacterium]